MLNTVGVGTDGTPTASIAVGAAIELAERNNARLVLISSYHNGSNVQTRSEQAPLDIQMVGAAPPRLRPRCPRARRDGGPVR